jgi:hypothetical protein
LNKTTSDLGHHRLGTREICLPDFPLDGKAKQMARELVVKLLAWIRWVELQWFLKKDWIEFY